MNIYIAAALAQAPFANLWAQVVEKHGYKIVSRWHGTVMQGMKDPQDILTRQSLLTENLIDIQQCDLVLALCSTGNPRATFCEIGYALRAELPVIWLQKEDGEGGNLFDSHPKVFIAKNDKDVTDWLDKFLGY